MTGKWYLFSKSNRKDNLDEISLTRHKIKKMKNLKHDSV